MRSVLPPASSTAAGGSQSVPPPPSRSAAFLPSRSAQLQATRQYETAPASSVARYRAAEPPDCLSPTRVVSIAPCVLQTVRQNSREDTVLDPRRHLHRGWMRGDKEMEKGSFGVEGKERKVRSRYR